MCSQVPCFCFCDSLLLHRWRQLCLLSLLPGVEACSHAPWSVKEVGLHRARHKSDFGRNIPGGGISNHTFLKTTPGLLIITAPTLEQINSLAATDPNTPHEGIFQSQEESLDQVLMDGDRLLRGAAVQEFCSSQSLPTGPQFSGTVCS